MILIRHELRRGRAALLIWTGAIAFLLTVCVFLFPEMKAEMDAVSEMFASMGSFTAAFGMDKLNFGTLIGYYAIECGNVLGLGGAFFAAMTGAGMLCKEERDGTAEFLLTHPLRRGWVLGQKLAALGLQLVALNLTVYLLALGSMAAIGEAVPWRELNLLHLAYFLLQLELAAVCFGLSAFLRRGSAGVGLGLAALCYAMNLMANITDSLSFLKYVTPFGYCDGAEIVADGALDPGKLAVGLALAAAGILAACWYYPRKDIR